MANVNVLKGMVLTKIDNSHPTELLFYLETGELYRMYPGQEYWKHVYLEDICGDLNDLIGTPLLFVEELSEDPAPIEEEDSYAWTCYKFATTKGAVTIRWYGNSSESVEFELVE